MAFDAKRRQLWVHGGQEFVYIGPGDHRVVVDRLWRFDLTTGQWNFLTQSTPAPSARLGHHMLVDTLLDRLILWGGFSSAGATQDDWWSLPLSTTTAATWTRLNLSNAQPRPLDVAAFDPVRRVLSFAGGSGAARGGRFEFSFDDPPHWTTIMPDRIDPANGERLFVDAERGRAILVNSQLLYDTPVQPRPDWRVCSGFCRAQSRVEVERRNSSGMTCRVDRGGGALTTEMAAATG